MLLITIALMNLLAQATAAPAAPATPRTVLAGTVTEDASHAPIAGVQIRAMPSGPGPVSPDQLPVAVTDREGRFRFVGLPPGRYFLSAQKTGFASNGPISQITLNDLEQRTNIAITLQQSGVIAGRVLDQSGEPVVNASVMTLRRRPLLPGMPAQMQNTLMPGGNSVQTNDLGEFRLFGLTPGEYAVQVSVRQEMFGGAPLAGSTPVPTYYPGVTDPLAAQLITVAPGQTFGNVEIRMIELPSFQVSGVVRDRAGRTVSNALVRLTGSDNGAMPIFMSRMNQAHTDASGRFVLNNITAGSYTLSAIAPRVTPRANDGRGGTATGTGPAGGVVAGVVMSGGFNGTMGGVTTEMRNGITTEWRDDSATRMPLEVTDANLTGIEVVVRTAQ